MGEKFVDCGGGGGVLVAADDVDVDELELAVGIHIGVLDREDELGLTVLLLSLTSADSAMAETGSGTVAGT